MSTRIRLARHGRKRYPFYHIVVADKRAPRDGRLIERIGSYNPNTNPATVNLDFDRALYWVQCGAQPSDTCRAILSYRGVLMKDHLLKGVRKGALTPEQAEEKFQTWLAEKEQKIQQKKDGLAEAKKTAKKKRLEAESKIKEARAQELAKKNAALAKEVESTDETAEDTETAETTEPSNPEENKET